MRQDTILLVTKCGCCRQIIADKRALPDTLFIPLIHDGELNMPMIYDSMPDSRGLRREIEVREFRRRIDSAGQILYLEVQS